MNTLLSAEKPPEFRFSEHPWIAYFSMAILLVIGIILTAGLANSVGVPPNAPWRHLIVPTIPHLVSLFVIAPFALKIPNGRRTFIEYLRDIRLANIRPFTPLLMLGLSTSLIMLLSITASSFVFRLSQGGALNGVFLANAVSHLQEALPPQSINYIIAFPAIFEEVGRGIWLVIFGRKYSKNWTIAITALTFGFFHIINLLGGGDPVFVLRQVIFGCFVGVFYAIMILRTNSLLPAILFHYFVNFFMGNCGWYLNQMSGIADRLLFGTLNLVVVVPVLIVWVRFFAAKWIDGEKKVRVT